MHLVGVRFRASGPVRYFDPRDAELDVGDRVMVATANGEKEGRVIIAPQQVLYSELRGPLNPVVRKLSVGDAT
tara:strand:+ start:324 stop:542 length:219 start_codon:yes stop_codon:yes gene_type:complete